VLLLAVTGAVGTLGTAGLVSYYSGELPSIQSLAPVNLAPATRELDAALRHATVVVVNEVEEADLGGEARLRELGARAVVVTLGAEGARLDGERLPAPRVEALNSTGAGDAFCAALAVALLAGADLRRAVGWANRAGALCCSRPGTSAAMPGREELGPL